MTGIRRRDLLTGSVLLLANGELVKGEVISGQLPWHPGATAAPEPAKPGNCLFLTEPEAATLGGIADRIIPPDSQTPGGKDAGCVPWMEVA
jgi:gluconate 2-dehydrogenase gamma chain